MCKKKCTGGYDIMKSGKEYLFGMSMPGLALAFCIATIGTLQLHGQKGPAAKPQDAQEKTTTGFYCNTKALNPTERSAHTQLSEKLISSRKRIVETEKGYEFQFNSTDISLAELAQWVVAEAKCCPFFDFHIDLEEKGSLLCLRLTGEPGIKDFIRSQFPIPGK